MTLYCRNIYCQSAGDIVNVVPYLLRDVGFLSRPHLLRVFKLCCLVAGVSVARYPAVSLDLSGFALSVADFQSCVQLVQSYILSEGYSHQSFFSDQTLIVVKKAIADAGRFFGASDFSMWTDFCREDVDAFVVKYSALFTTFLAERRKSFDARYVEFNNANRMSRLSDSGDTAGSSGSLSSVIQRKRQDTGPLSVVSMKSGGSKSSNGGTKSESKSATISFKRKQQKTSVVIRVVELVRLKEERKLYEMLMMMVLVVSRSLRKCPKTVDDLVSFGF